MTTACTYTGCGYPNTECLGLCQRDLRKLREAVIPPTSRNSIDDVTPAEWDAASRKVRNSIDDATPAEWDAASRAAKWGTPVRQIPEPITDNERRAVERAAQRAKQDPVTQQITALANKLAEMDKVLQDLAAALNHARGDRNGR